MTYSLFQIQELVNIAYLKAREEERGTDAQDITASGMGSHAEGYGTTASGDFSHAEGMETTASATCHAEGMGTISQNNAEHAEGKYNKSNKKTNGTATQNAAGSTLHSVGIGTSANGRKNAFEIMQNGDVYIKGVGGYDGIYNDGIRNSRLSRAMSFLYTDLSTKEAHDIYETVHSDIASYTDISEGDYNFSVVLFMSGEQWQKIDTLYFTRNPAYTEFMNMLDNLNDNDAYITTIRAVYISCTSYNYVCYDDTAQYGDAEFLIFVGIENSFGNYLMPFIFYVSL